MTVLKTKINGLWTEIAGDVSPIAQVPQNVLDFVAFWTPTAWVNATLQNGWVNLSPQVIQYRKVGDIVYLRGGTASGTFAASIFILPVGFRPPFNLVFPVTTLISGNFAYGAMQVASTGDCQAYTPATNARVDINGISFSIT